MVLRKDAFASVTCAPPFPPEIDGFRSCRPANVHISPGACEFRYIVARYNWHSEPNLRLTQDQVKGFCPYPGQSGIAIFSEEQSATPSDKLVQQGSCTVAIWPNNQNPNPLHLCERFPSSSLQVDIFSSQFCYSVVSIFWPRRSRLLH